MDLSFTPAQRAFRDEVRAFLARQLPADLAARVVAGQRLAKDDFVRWQRILHAQGWGAATWPREHGGPGWTAIEQHLFDEECALAGAPMQIPFGLRMVAPVLMAFGTAAQQQRFLPRIASGDDWWCQGYSEPGAGSDLASLTTRAERAGDHYVVNGQKTWTTYAQHADWMFCLVRTDTQARAQEGISFLLVDMKAPGVTVRPIRMLDGDHEINEVWLEDVRVPIDQRVGDENKGWTCAKYLLLHERTLIVQLGASKRELRRLISLAATTRQRGRPLLDDARVRDRIAQLEIDLMGLEVSLLRMLVAAEAQRSPGPEASLLKVRGTELHQAISELLLLVAGPQAVPCRPAALEPGGEIDASGCATSAAQYFNLRKTTIFGGSTEIQKNIVAQRILGL
jgi:alkylation response protein AidB-like acyl-CoA dehydrogenase